MGGGRDFSKWVPDMEKTRDEHRRCSRDGSQVLVSVSRTCGTTRGLWHKGTFGDLSNKKWRLSPACALSLGWSQGCHETCPQVMHWPSARTKPPKTTGTAGSRVTISLTVHVHINTSACAQEDKVNQE